MIWWLLKRTFVYGFRVLGVVFITIACFFCFVIFEPRAFESWSEVTTTILKDGFR